MNRALMTATLTLLVVVPLVISCSDSSPTEPSPVDLGGGGPAPAAGATLTGEVSEVEGGGGPGGIAVAIEGTGLTATTADDGTFRVEDVPEGDRRVRFEAEQVDGEVAIERVEEGESIELVVALRSNGAEVEHMARTGGGPDARGDLSLELQPDTWNTDWLDSAGTVSAFLRGDGFDAIDPATVELWLTDPADPAAVPVFPTRTQLGGNHLRAFFAKSEAMAAVIDPVPGETIVATVRFVRDGASEELTDVVTVVGDGLPGGDEAAVELEKATNGVDADDPPGPEIPIGDPVSWTYEVANVGAVDLLAILVEDDQGELVTCPATTLAPGESMTCTAEGVAIEGPYANLGTVTAEAPDGLVVSDSDPSHYTGGEVLPAEGACGVGFWRNHPEDWAATGYDPAQRVDSVFVEAAAYPDLAVQGLSDALANAGGPDLEDAAALLVRHAIPALLSAAHPDVIFSLDELEVIADTDAALASADRDVMLDTKDGLEAEVETGEEGCPL